MSLSRWYLWVLCAGLLASMDRTFAQSELSNATFQDWSGLVNQIDLPDGSVLFEYVARSFSGRVEGGMVALTFVPRFDCAPVVTVRMPDKTGEVGRETQLFVETDGLQDIYRVVADAENGFITYAIAASIDDLVELREAFDASSRLNFSIVSDSDGSTAELGSPMDSAATIGFSLLGSRLSAEAVEGHCLAHEAVPFLPK